MCNEEFREELQKITRNEDISSHVAKISELSAQFGCSIRVLSDYDPAQRENFNCYEYALGLNTALHNSTVVILSEFRVLVDDHFIDHLLKLSALRGKSLKDMEDGDLVIYFKGGGGPTRRHVESR